MLPPRAGISIQKALATVAPAIRLDSASVHKDEVRLRICSDRGCATARLTDPEAGCVAARRGPWCWRWEGGPAAAQEAMEPAIAALERLDESAIYKRQNLGSSPRPGRHAPPLARLMEHLSRRSRVSRGMPDALQGPNLVRVLFLALAYLLGSVSLGWALGRPLRRRLQSPSWRRTLIALPFLLSPPAAWLLLPSLPWIGAWDILLALLLASLGFARGLRISRGRLGQRALGPLVALVLTATLLEIGTRWLAPFDPEMPPSAQARLVFRYETREYGCAALEPEAHPYFIPMPCPEAGAEDQMCPEKPRVIHVGDSMVHGDTLDPSETFSAELGRLQPGVAHLRAGFPFTGTDLHWLVARTWARYFKPTLIILHIFTGNDILDMARPYICCDAGPLADFSGAKARALCPPLRWHFDRRRLVVQSPAPFILRALSDWSAFARLTVHAWGRWSNAIVLDDHSKGRRQDDPALWHAFELSVRALRDDLRALGVPLRVVLLPQRAALESKNPPTAEGNRVRLRMKAVLEKLGIEPLDPWPLFLELVQRDGPGPWFAKSVPWDMHFSKKGHARYARWLLDSLPELRALAAKKTTPVVDPAPASP